MARLSPTRPALLRNTHQIHTHQAQKSVQLHKPRSINRMFWSTNNSHAVEETHLDMELQGTHREDGVGTQVPVDGTEVRPQTQRGLKSRHIQLLALGGSVGTGLFVGTSTTLSLAGPASLFMCTSPQSGLDSRRLTHKYSLRCHISHRLDGDSNLGGDDNFSPGQRGFGAVLRPPLLRTFLGFCSRMELLVFVCHAGGSRDIRCKSCHRLLG